MYLLSALFSAFFSTLALLHKMISVNWRFFKPKSPKKPQKSPFRVQEQITWKIALCPIKELFLCLPDVILEWEASCSSNIIKRIYWIVQGNMKILSSMCTLSLPLGYGGRSPHCKKCTIIYRILPFST